MFAVFAQDVDPHDPLTCLAVGDLPEAETPADWVTINVRAATLNQHDLLALQGLLLDRERVPMILGSDVAGVTDTGSEVVVHTNIPDPSEGADELLGAGRTILSELHPGTFAERVRVPADNVFDLPPSLSAEQAACLPTAYLTAYRMLRTKAGIEPGDTVLVQGIGGGVSTALVLLGKALGLRVWVTSRRNEKLAWARSLGADEAFLTGTNLPEQVDAVMETVGEATWDHSLSSLKPGGTIVVTGATSGDRPPAQLQRILYHQYLIVGSTMGTRQEFIELLDLVERAGIAPIIDRTWPMDRAKEAFAAMVAGNLRGKLVLTAPGSGVRD